MLLSKIPSRLSTGPEGRYSKLPQTSSKGLCTFAPQDARPGRLRWGLGSCVAQVPVGGHQGAQAHRQLSKCTASEAVRPGREAHVSSQDPRSTPAPPPFGPSQACVLGDRLKAGDAQKKGISVAFKIGQCRRPHLRPPWRLQRPLSNDCPPSAALSEH